jgi:hypothetical protein
MMVTHDTINVQGSYTLETNSPVRTCHLAEKHEYHVSEFIGHKSDTGNELYKVHILGTIKAKKV